MSRAIQLAFGGVRSRSCVLTAGALTAVALTAFITGVAVRPCFADEESPALLKYRESVDQAVNRGLEYLAQAQTDEDLFPGQYGNTSAVAALTGMAFLSKGYSPGRGPYGRTIDRCIDLVLRSEQTRDGQPNGYLVRTPDDKMYGHFISTLFLSEVSGMVDPERQRRIDDVLPRALQLIIDAQNVQKAEQFQGGWRYEPTSGDSDLSLTGWAVMALRSARLNGARIPDENVRKSVEFILRCRPPDTQGEAGYGYQPNQGHNPAMTGVAILCLSLTGQHDNPTLPKAGQFVLDANVNANWGGGHFFYTNYYCTQAMFQLRGEYWEKWAVPFYENAVLRNQKEDGSWGDAYSTAMTILALTVSYRQLPVYQR